MLCSFGMLRVQQWWGERGKKFWTVGKAASFVSQDRHFPSTHYVLPVKSYFPYTRSSVCSIMFYRLYPIFRIRQVLFIPLCSTGYIRFSVPGARYSTVQYSTQIHLMLRRKYRPIGLVSFINDL